MKFWIDRQAILSLIEESNYEKREEFLSYGDLRRKQYSVKQQAYALSLIPEHGIRGVSRILKIPRMTIQRWCRRINYPVPRCPQWVFERAERWKRRKRNY